MSARSLLGVFSPRKSLLVLGFGLAMAGNALAVEPIKVGLVAALSGQSAKSGEAPDPRPEPGHR
jgi:hypothetical protein